MLTVFIYNLQRKRKNNFDFLDLSIRFGII